MSPWGLKIMDPIPIHISCQHVASYFTVLLQSEPTLKEYQAAEEPF